MDKNVVKLTVNQRMQGMTSEQAQFRDLLLRHCKGDSTVDDWKLLLTRQPSNVSNLCDFEDATRLQWNVTNGMIDSLLMLRLARTCLNLAMLTFFFGV